MNRSAKDGARSSPHYGAKTFGFHSVAPRCLRATRWGRASVTQGSLISSDGKVLQRAASLHGSASASGRCREGASRAFPKFESYGMFETAAAVDGKSRMQLWGFMESVV
jgi:hypothetical protein